MPELVEVEKLVRQLRPALVGRSLAYYESLRKAPAKDTVLEHLLRKNTVAEWDAHVLYSPIESLSRVGKNLIFRLASGWMLQLHLNSTGWVVAGNEAAESATEINPSHEAFIYTAIAKSPLKHAMVALRFDDGQLWYFCDPRKWGRFYLWPTHAIETAGDLGKYGPDWLTQRELAVSTLFNWRRHSPRTVKEVWLDQTISAGVGNWIYNEACFHAGVHPLQKWATLTDSQIYALAEATAQQIDWGMQSTDYWFWKVFGKKGDYCPKGCGSVIAYVKDFEGSTRGNYFCPTCQPKNVESSNP